MVVKKKARRVISVEEDPPKVEDGDSLDIYAINQPHPDVFSSGCRLLDKVLGGGWAYSRIANIVGSEASGKTLLAIEAAANFIRDNPEGRVIYVEAEAAFDLDYAAGLGLPVAHVDFPELVTVEDVFEDLEKRLGESHRTLYIIDSLDALSDRDEQERKIDAGSYAMTKQKKLSELFRRMVKKLKHSQVTMFVVSQTREAIGVAYGDKLKRSGGKALDYYASQVLWLKKIKNIEPQRKKVKRVIGVNVVAKCRKNKVGPPFREAKFPILFSFGVEDLEACLVFLIEHERTDALNLTKEETQSLVKKIWKLSDADYVTELNNARESVSEVWDEIDREFDPGRRKYELLP
jgi:recombination protein RecA